MTKYIETYCGGCRMDLLIETNDISDNNYCTPCAWAILEGDFSSWYYQNELMEYTKERERELI